MRLLTGRPAAGAVCSWCLAQGLRDLPVDLLALPVRDFAVSVAPPRSNWPRSCRRTGTS